MRKILAFLIISVLVLTAPAAATAQETSAPPETAVTLSTPLYLQAIAPQRYEGPMYLGCVFSPCSATQLVEPSSFQLTVTHDRDWIVASGTIERTAVSLRSDRSRVAWRFNGHAEGRLRIPAVTLLAGIKASRRTDRANDIATGRPFRSDIVGTATRLHGWIGAEWAPISTITVQARGGGLVADAEWGHRPRTREWTSDAFIALLDDTFRAWTGAVTVTLFQQRMVRPGVTLTYRSFTRDAALLQGATGRPHFTDGHIRAWAAISIPEIDRWEIIPEVGYLYPDHSNERDALLIEDRALVRIGMRYTF